MTVRRGGIGRLAAALALTAGMAAASACAPTQDPPNHTRLRLSTGFPNGTWDMIGQALAKAYTERLPDVTATGTPNDDLEGQADAIEHGDADLALEDAETAYVAYSKGTTSDPTPHREVRAIAVLFSTAVQIVARRDAAIVRIADLRGRRVDVGAKGSPVERAARLILQSHGLSYSAVQPVYGVADPAAELRAGTLDARFFYAPFQQPVVSDIARSVEVRFLPLEPRTIAAIQDEHHFLKSITLPAATYRNQNEDILTVGMDVLLLCRRDLADRLVYDLTTVLFDSVPALRRAHEAASGIDPDRGPTASVPLHPGAARYYREREILQ
jgi:TRAP transporter TAXI family solute receptor